MNQPPSRTTTIPQPTAKHQPYHDPWRTMVCNVDKGLGNGITCNPEVQKMAQRIVRSQWFEFTSGFVILLLRGSTGVWGDGGFLNTFYFGL